MPSKSVARRPAGREKKSAAVLSAEAAALHQKQTRQQHAQERAQDYVEAIASLIEETGEARAADLARLLGVSHVTVIRTVARLRRHGLVTTRPYRSIFLTDPGRDLAQKSRLRHQLVVEFLEALGISPRAARADAEGLEHHVGEETLTAFKAFLKKKKS